MHIFFLVGLLFIAQSFQNIEGFVLLLKQGQRWNKSRAGKRCKQQLTKELLMDGLGCRQQTLGGYRICHSVLPAASTIVSLLGQMIILACGPPILAYL